MAKNPIIGREEELKTLKKLQDSSKSEFLAIYGRRHNQNHIPQFDHNFWVERK